MNGIEKRERCKKGLLWLAGCLAAVTALGALGQLLWSSGCFLPGWIVWENREMCDSSGRYRIVLQRRQVQVFGQDALVWTSPKGVKVQDALTCDIDGNGQDELILLCWKVGRYGSHKPFWVGEDEKTWSQHLFVYDYGQDTIRPKWMSSYIGQDVLSIKENQKEAPDTRLWLTDREQKVSSWKWDSWGFSKEDTDISFGVLGDLIAHEPIYRCGLLQEGNFDFLFENLTEVLAKKDVTAINQETPLVDDPAKYGDYPRFGTPEGVGQAIVDAGFDVVTCATNHMLDRGAEGAAYTEQFFKEREVLCLGIASTAQEESAYETLTRKGVRFGLLNYTYGTNGMALPKDAPVRVRLLEEEETVRREIETAAAETDLVIVFVHWGTENETQPDDFQKKWAQVFLESGADVVIGTHPHALQPVEVLTDGAGHEMLIYYSIGNFVSAQPRKSCVKGGMAEFCVSLTPEGFRVTEYDLKPLEILWQEGGTYTVRMAEDEASLGAEGTGSKG